MQRTNLYLDERQTAALDQISRAQGISRAEVVRRVIDRSLASESADLDSDLAAIESSFGVLAEAALSDRGPDARAAHIEGIRRR